MNILRSKLKRNGFRRNQSGSTAVEFAVIAPIFLALMFSTFEVGWFYFTNSVLDAATSNSGRLIRTGQVQGWGGDEEEKFEEFYDRICDVVQVWGDCQDRLTVEVQVFETFEDLAADSTPMTCADAPVEDIAAIPFEPGDELQIIRVRTCLIYNTINPAIGTNLSEEASTQRRLISSLIFRNEPYEVGGEEE